MIYPSAVFEQLSPGSVIKTITFYADDGSYNNINTTLKNATIEVRIGEVTESTVTATGLSNRSLLDESNLVYSGQATISSDNKEMTFTLSGDGYTWNGDNLAIELYIASGSGNNQGNLNWKVASAQAGSSGRYMYNNRTNKATTNANIAALPQLTITYEPGVLPDYKAKVTPDAIDFGKILPNTTSTQNVTVTNKGNNPFTPIVTGLTSPFSTTYTPTEISNGESVTIPIAFAPTAEGDFDCTFQVCDAGGNFDAIDVILVGVAKNEVTVADGNMTSEVLPIDGYNFDAPQVNQMLYRAGLLESLQGKKIKSMTFYPANGINFYKKDGTEATIIFSLGNLPENTEQYTYPAERKEGYEPVQTIVMPDHAQNITEWTITFDTPFEYTGGDLLIDVDATSGQWGNTNFYATTTTEYLAYTKGSRTNYLPKVTFAYEEDETPVVKVDPEMEFEPDEMTVYVGADKFTAPTLTTTPADMTVTYNQEGDEDVALVDETSGEVLIGDKTGDVVVTANFAGDDNYNPGSASYTIHVVNKPELTVDEAVEFEATVGETKSKTFGVLGTDLQGDVTLTLNDETGYFTIDPVTITKAAAEELAEVTVTYTPMAEGFHEATVTVTSKDAEPKTVSLSAIAIIPTPAVAAPTFNVPEGEYTEAQNIVITCATEGANISYSTDGGSSWTSGHFVVLKEDTELMAKAEKDGETATATAIYFITLPELAQVAPIDGYFRIKNLGNNKYANIAGRKTMNFTDAPADKAGTVIRVVTNENGQVQVLRSQGADLQRYADRAMTYIPEIVRLVVDKLNADEPGGILGESGLDKLLQKFNEEFDYHLYVEPAEGGYRIYGKTPSMQPVVDFYFENKAKVDEKLPQLQDFVNQAIDKILEKTEGHGASILVDYSIAEVWQRMGGQLTQPVDEASTMKFYEEVLTNKDNVWNFAYQSAMIYWEKLKANTTFQNYVNEMGDFAQYIDRVEQIRPDFKYYIAQLNDKPDFISQGNKDVNAARNIWALEENTAFTVNFPAENLNSGKYVTTLYTDFAYDLPEGVTAYKVIGYTNLGDANLEALSGTVPAQTPVILMAAEAGNQTLTVNMDNGTAPSGNLLVGPDYLITTYSIKTPMVENIFNMAKGLMGDEFYNNYLAQYEHLMLKNAGTVNNKYFWGLPYDDVKGCTYMNENDEKECVVRSLDVEDGRVAFYNNTTVSTNKAFLVSEEFNVIRLGLRGDVNRDGHTTIADVTALIDILLTDPVNPSALPQFDYIAADFNENGQIKINDVTALIDYLLSNDLH